MATVSEWKRTACKLCECNCWIEDPPTMAGSSGFEERLEREGLVERHRYEHRPPRYEHRLSEKGRDLWPVLASMLAYGSEWLFDGPTPGKLVDTETRREILPMVVDGSTMEPVDLRRTRLVARGSDDA